MVSQLSTSSRTSKSSSTKVKNDLCANKLKISTGLSRSYRSHLKVYGKPNSAVKANNDKESGSNSNMSPEPGTSGTQISAIIGKNDQSSQMDQEINLTQKVNGNLIYGIVYPLIICGETKLQQPVLLILKKSNFFDNEIELPFSGFLDMGINCFKFKVGKYNFRGHIMALGESPLDLKISLQENINSNEKWKGLPKMKRLGISDFQHSPLGEGEKIPSYKIMSSAEVEDLFKMEKLNSQTCTHNREKDIHLGSQKQAISMMIDKPTGSNIIKDSGKKNLELSDHETEVNKKKKSEDIYLEGNKQEEMVTDLSVVDSLIGKVNLQITDLLARKSFLSNLDTTGNILITMIDVLDTFRKIIDHKKQESLDIANNVPKDDETFKISPKNQIFIEGLIQLDLDLYETATKQAKPNNPSSMAYSLVKYSFPKEYTEDVVLGKRFYDKSEIDHIMKAKESDSNTKYPLAFIWGFKDPYNSRLEGNCDHKLGNQRIRAFFNHIFRKSKIFNYSKEAEKAVRRRIMKEFCALNSEISEKKDHLKAELDDQKSSDSQESNTFDLECFLDNLDQ